MAYHNGSICIWVPPPLCMGATVFIVHCGGKPSARARLKIRVSKGARHSLAYIMCSARNPVWSMDFLCCKREREREREIDWFCSLMQRMEYNVWTMSLHIFLISLDAIVECWGWTHVHMVSVKQPYQLSYIHLGIGFWHETKGPLSH